MPANIRKIEIYHMDFSSLINGFIDLNVNVFQRIRLTKINVLGFEFILNQNTESVDERIRKIDAAKQNLLDGLTAIDELKNEAETNKKEVENALKRLAELQTNKADLQSEVQDLQKVITSDVSAFQKLANVPSSKQIKKERIIGFISGITASVIASGIVWLIIDIYKRFSN